jgi:hypothetical protein
MECLETLAMVLVLYCDNSINLDLKGYALFFFALQVSELWKTYMRHQDPAETLNKDIISHFVLRLVYCRT